MKKDSPAKFIFVCAAISLFAMYTGASVLGAGQVSLKRGIVLSGTEAQVYGISMIVLSIACAIAVWHQYEKHP
jgi:hypothetical protein